MTDSTQKKKPIIGITTGDVNGIGLEVIIKSLDDSRIFKQFTPIIYGSAKAISFYRKALDKENFYYWQVESTKQARHKKVNVINVWEEPVGINPGKANKIGSKYARISLEHAVDDLKKGHIHAIATAPLSKELAQNDEFEFLGHTEYLTKEAGTKESLMFLVHPQLKVGVVTGHIPLQKVPEAITQEKIAAKLRIMLKSLHKDFGIKKPRVAVLGLNPHAGENGLLGKEELDIIGPVINQFKSNHDLVFGPFSADGFFGMNHYIHYDAILAMYHDQGLIPFKTLAFEQGVNYTAGLPFVRTSPSHGTAFSIAGKNEADPTSFRNALYLACDIVKQRGDHHFEKEKKNE